MKSKRNRQRLALAIVDANGVTQLRRTAPQTIEAIRKAMRERGFVRAVIKAGPGEAPSTIQAERQPGGDP